MIKIVLVSPQMPGNVGSVIRTCACFGYELYIIGPTPFLIKTEKFKRYAASHLIEPIYYNDIREFLHFTNSDIRIGTSSRATNNYFNAEISKNSFILFGSESKGLGDALENVNYSITIPMKHHNKCLNLAVSVGIIASHFFSKNNIFF